MNTGEILLSILYTVLPVLGALALLLIWAAIRHKAWAKERAEKEAEKAAQKEAEEQALRQQEA